MNNAQNKVEQLFEKLRNGDREPLFILADLASTLIEEEKPNFEKAVLTLSHGMLAISEKIQEHFHAAIWIFSIEHERHTAIKWLSETISPASKDIENQSPFAFALAKSPELFEQLLEKHIEKSILILSERKTKSTPYREFPRDDSTQWRHA